MSTTAKILTGVVGLLLLNTPAIQGDDLPDPDGKLADMTQPVKVFILMGQSNMLGAGKVSPGKKGGEGTLEQAVKEKKKYPYLVDDTGKWTERKDVRNVRVMSGKGNWVKLNQWMTIDRQKLIGPEHGIGHHLGNHHGEPVLILKSCIGNRALGWDLLPPGSPGFEFQALDKKTKEMKTWVYPGYKESPQRWEKGTEPVKLPWYAGKQYDSDVANAKAVLAELETYYPGAKSYEVAGFFWWQGDRDKNDPGHSSRYERNLAALVTELRKDFNSPRAKFVCATLGQTNKENAEGNEKLILDAMFALEKNPDFAGDVATVYSHPLSMGGASNSHYNGNAETYMNVGEAMGKAMVDLLRQP